jgi:glutamyl-tRNA reductase
MGVSNKLIFKHMMNGLKLWNFNTGTLPDEELLGNIFVLKTCQRSLVLAFDTHPFQHAQLPEHELNEGQNAYMFLLETICGLKSKLIGENEIVGQFKDAYKTYASSTLKDTRLLLILEKLFKDAKDIRTQYLIGISQKTYASLTRRHLIQKARAPHVVILGSGQLAEDLINQFKKKATVSLCARNASRVEELAKQHKLNVIPWENRHELVNEPFIANTIGHDSVLWDEDFFKAWAAAHESRLFVDLGSPSVIRSELRAEDGIVRLDDIFAEGAIVEDQKQQQIELARTAMLSITHKRTSLFEAKLNRNPPLLTPQIKSDMRYL